MARDRRNGVEVRGLRVLRTDEHTAARSLRTFVNELLGALLGGIGDERQHVLTVYDGPHNPVAKRRFDHERAAEDARQRFVQTVEAMDQDAYRSANWQAVLDSV